MDCIFSSEWVVFSSFFEDGVLLYYVFVNNMPYKLGYNPSRRIKC